MLLAISGILARIPVKGKMAHELHCSYSVRIIKVPSQILLTPAINGRVKRGSATEGSKFDGFVTCFRHLKLQAKDDVSSYGTSVPFGCSGLVALL